ncbi:hypothetical protein MTO96_014395 [Rhipicephalus appendiculatus]
MIQHCRILCRGLDSRGEPEACDRSMREADVRLEAQEKNNRVPSRLSSCSVVGHIGSGEAAKLRRAALLLTKEAEASRPRFGT